MDTGLGAAVTAAQAASRLTQIIVVVAPGATGSSARRSSGATSRSSGRSTGWSSAEVLSWLTRAGLHLLLRLPVNDWCRLLLLLLGRRFGVFAFHFAILAAILLHPGTEVTALVRRKLTAPHRLTGGTGHVGRLVALLTNDHVELNDLTVAHRADRFFWVVPRNGALVHKDILSGVVAVDEAVAALHVEPLDGAGDFGGDDFLGGRSGLALLSLQLVQRLLLVILLLRIRRILLLLRLLLRLLLFGGQWLTLRGISHRLSWFCYLLFGDDENEKREMLLLLLMMVVLLLLVLFVSARLVFGVLGTLSTATNHFGCCF